MTDPTVCAILLTRDRPAMAKRAVESFRRQTYANKRLVIVYSGSEYPCPIDPDDGGDEHLLAVDPKVYSTIGALRNFANRAATALGADFIAHADDDDYSAPQRLAEQVALLTASGADAVGYSDLLFWKFPIYGMVTMPEGWTKPICEYGEAWLYSRPTRLNVPGTTLCYWRKAWERKPFPHLPEVGNPTSQGEDIVWQSGLKVVAVSSVQASADYVSSNSIGAPRMIASVHSGNTMAAGYSHMGHVEEFARTPEWDSYCVRVMEMK